jgi:hypothetical protein
VSLVGGRLQISMTKRNTWIAQVLIRRVGWLIAVDSGLSVSLNLRFEQQGDLKGL